MTWFLFYWAVCTLICLYAMSQNRDTPIPQMLICAAFGGVILPGIVVWNWWRKRHALPYELNQRGRRVR